jgi:putative flavoprotein involved in K+ transport
MRQIDAVIVGGGQAGLAMSRCLTSRAVPHVVLERGRVAERWRSERWQSLRLLTPNWQTRLPGFRYQGSDPNGFMTVIEVVDFLEQFARSFDAPVHTDTEVTAVSRDGPAFRVSTNRETWLANCVIVATGYCDVPFVPAIASGIPDDIDQVVPARYRGPSTLREGAVLVVGAAASGIQLAHELRLAGRRVFLAAGQHTRVPRRYRGHDILWWFERIGIFAATQDDVYDVEVSREQASLQLVGRPDRTSIDLALLKELGVEVTGRLRAFERRRAAFADDLVATTAAADVKLAQLLQRIDTFIELDGTGGADAREPFEPIWTRFTDARTEIDLTAEGITTILWATGFTRQYPWLRVPVLDARGEIRNHGGVTPVEGLYVLGLAFLRHRNSNFIDGVGRDAEAVADHVARHLTERRSVIA